MPHQGSKETQEVLGEVGKGMIVEKQLKCAINSLETAQVPRNKLFELHFSNRRVVEDAPVA